MKDQTIVRLHTCRLLNVGLQRQVFFFKKDQTIVKLNTCRLLNGSLQRQVVYFFKGTILQSQG